MEIGIVGGSIAGCTAAVELIRAGHRVTVCTYHHGREVEGVHTVRIPPVPGYRPRRRPPPGPAQGSITGRGE